MWKIVVAAATTLLITSYQPTRAQAPYGQAPYAPYAQPPSPADPSQIPSDTDFKSFPDRRIEIVKLVLQLTPEQASLWPAVEEAIRARSMARFARWQGLAERFRSQGGDTSPIDR